MNLPTPATTDAPERASARALRRLRGFVTIAALVVLADQASKALVRDRLGFDESWPAGWTLIHFSHVENAGAAFGILQGAGGFLVAAGLVAVAGVTFFLLTLPSHSRFYPTALSLILGGALGNLIDRVRFGAVTDFIDPIYYPAFNLADSCIVVGVAALLVLSWLDDREQSRTKTSGAPASNREAQQ